MPTHSESRSPSPKHPKHRSSHRRDRLRDYNKDDESPERTERSIPPSVEPISEDDYFLKSAEFSRWLRVEKGKYFNELKADKARSYFRKFVKAWNRGKLPDDLYIPVDSTSVASNQQTSYKWSFASNRSKVDATQLSRVRESVGDDTYGPSPSSSSGPSRGRVLGPTLPSASDMQLVREEAESLSAANNLLKRKREKLEDKERVEDLVGPKEVGREGMLEKKRAKRETDKAFQETRDDAGLEVSEDVLMGGGSFKERLAQRDAARARFEAKKRSERDAKEQERNERVEQMKEKERKTMEMFKQMAKERFG